MSEEKDKKKKPRGRPERAPTKERHMICIKLTTKEMEEVTKLAEPYNGNMNKLYRVKVLGEK